MARTETLMDQVGSTRGPGQGPGGFSSMLQSVKFPPISITDRITTGLRFRIINNGCQKKKLQLEPQTPRIHKFIAAHVTRTVTHTSRPNACNIQSTQGTQCHPPTPSSSTSAASQLVQSHHRLHLTCNFPALPAPCSSSTQIASAFNLSDIAS